MAYSTGLLNHRVQILNRTTAQQGRFGLDSAGVEFEPAGAVWASVDWQKGKSGMNAGSLDVYGVKIVRMRWNSIITERSRIQWQGRTYQILPDSFNPDRQENTIQFLMQQVINDK